MTDSQPRKKLFNHYRGLSPWEKTVVQACCVIDEPTSPIALQRLLVSANLLNSPTDLPNPQEMRACLAGLQAADLLDKKQQCHPLIIELVLRETPPKNLQLLTRLVRNARPAKDAEQAPNLDRLTRDIRLDLHLKDFDRYSTDLLVFLDYFHGTPIIHPLVRIIANPFEPEWLASLPAHIQVYALQEIIKDSLTRLSSPQEVLSFLEDPEHLAALPEAALPAFNYLRLGLLLLTGKLQEAGTWLEQTSEADRPLGLLGWHLCLNGKFEPAREQFGRDLEQLREGNQNPHAYFTGVEGLFYLLALLQADDFTKLNIASVILRDLENVQPSNPHLASFATLRDMVAFLCGQPQPGTVHQPGSQSTGLAALFNGWADYWMGRELINQKELQLLFSRAQKAGYRWLAMEYAELLARATKNEPCLTYARQIRRETGMCPMIDVVKLTEPWQRALKALNLAVPLTMPETDRSRDIRLAWFVEFSDHDLNIIPREQKISASGDWSKGRTLSLKKLETPDRLTYLTRQDKAICACLRKETRDWGSSLKFDNEKAIPAMVGHPHIYLLEYPDISTQLLRGDPEVRVREDEQALHLTFFPPLGAANYVIIRETTNIFRYIPITNTHRRYARIIGKNGLTIPATDKERALRILGAAKAPLTIHAAMRDVFETIEEVQPDATIHVQLSPYGDGFRLALSVRPFHTGGPYLKPGRGATQLIAEINGRRVQTRRDFRRETENAQTVKQSCANLNMSATDEDEWIIDQLDDCLQILSDLRELDEKIAVVEWPEGKKLTVSRQVSFKQLHVQVRRQQDWFELDGRLELDDSLILDMRRLLELSEKSRSRFVPLGNGHFLALNNELRNRLEELNAITRRKDKKTYLHPLAAPDLTKLTNDGAQLQGDQNWHDWVRNIEEVRDYCPPIPSTLQARLRDYQTEGYHWLARLARWGVGACLADDMGLGKTLQALAIILHRAPAGPTLVVAPTSVYMNWREEAGRFAPTLNVIHFSGKNRQELLDALGPLDVLVTSYALLQIEGGALADIQWQTIVLDEAQAIKNTATKRSRAAMALQGEFKLVTTGTPIENHLGELWNIFQFINPGLLGSRQSFNKRYAGPIERDDRRDVRQKLKKLIQPFILRRLKSDVLQELPARTEILLKVEMNKQETAFYEALRQRAIEGLDKSRLLPRQKNIQILAEISRLRRACCNTRLVVPDSKIPSSKLQLFTEIIEELLEGGHKALVFSQFVDHLTIVREYLDNQGIAYHYLDGATPTAQRHKRVTAFQAGDGELFLISLKAGGVGLNLTAADYVIHLDPWWNPAVEDQASDRAHRIGQQHPVTIYRLVVQNSIEEKIVALHQAKKDLANSLLSGGELSGKLNTEELLRLMKEE